MTKKYATAVREYEVAFRMDKKLVEDIDASHLAAAAGCACLASQSNELDETQKSQLRAKAVEWLLLKLDMHRELVDNGSTEDRIDTIATMLYLKRDPDLAAIRENAGSQAADLVQNPNQRLWQRVEQIIEDARHAILAKPD